MGIRKKMVIAILVFVVSNAAPASELRRSIERQYQSYLKSLYEHFHANPELSLVENKTAARMAKELTLAGFKVTENVGGTGLVAIMENGKGPLVMMRADMDGLPVEEKSGLSYASKVTQISPITKRLVPVAHACGHDMHITSLVGTAREMHARRDSWSGTLMLVVQPAEERGIGAKAMRADNIYERFGTPNYALALHVTAGLEAGKINIIDGSPFAGADSVDIIVHGVGAHGASPHAGKDPIVLASQIVLALQTLVSRELAPHSPGVVTVGSFHSGTKHNIISDRAHLQVTVRNTSTETRDKLLTGIKRIAENMGRVAGLPDDKLPQVIIGEESVPPSINHAPLAQRLRTVWQQEMGEDQVTGVMPEGMGAEDFPFFVTSPEIKNVYFTVGGTAKSDILAAANGGEPIASHHSPLFRIEPYQSVTKGVEATVLALFELMPAIN